MKAAVRTQYGPPELITIKEVDKPAPKDNELLVRVHAATVSRTDCGLLWGKPFVLRLFTGVPTPRSPITGSDFAGQVEALGDKVTAFKVGDRVMGINGIFGIRSHAQYLVAPETKGILTIPDQLTYEQAAACLEGAFYAASSINSLQPKAGQKALVNGATGAIGSSLVQLLKFYGVWVTAVCSGEHAGLVTSFGADRIIDYRKEDFTKDTGPYDYIFDTVANSTFSQCKPLLTEKGIYIPSDRMVNLLWAMLTSLTGGKKVAFSVPKDLMKGLHFIKELVVKGKFRPVIDRTYPLDEIADAYRYVATGQKIGNVIITMNA